MEKSQRDEETTGLRRVEAPGAGILVRLLLATTRDAALARWQAHPATVRRAYWWPPVGRAFGRN